MSDFSSKEQSVDVKCPFCNEDGFDLIGLKIHLQRGWCEKFIETADRFPERLEAQRS